MIAAIGKALWCSPKREVATALSELIEVTRRADQPASRLNGGVRLRVGGLVLNPGHGCAASHWRSWCRPMSVPVPEDAGPAWGWPPYRMRRVSGGGLRAQVYRVDQSSSERRHSQAGGAMVVELSRADLRALLTTVEASLSGATKRIHGWVRRYAPARLAAPVAAAFAFHVGLDRHPAVVERTLPISAPVLTVGCMPGWSGASSSPSWLPVGSAGPGWIRLHAGLSDAEVAYVTWVLLRDNGVDPGLDLGGDLRALIATMSRRDRMSPELTGGLIMTVDGEEELRPDCCCSVRGWRLLRRNLGEPEVDLSWGHGPTMHMKTTAGGPFRVVDQHGLTRAIVDRPRLGDMLTAVEADLAAAVVRVRQWLTGQGVSAIAAPVAALFATAVGLPMVDADLPAQRGHRPALWDASSGTVGQ